MSEEEVSDSSSSSESCPGLKVREKRGKVEKKRVKSG